MGVPKPSTSLDGSCSVIYNNTLYSYSSKGFQSLGLSAGSKWTELTMGESVTGAVCVNVDGSDPSMWVVGGAGASTYTGLQKYSFSTGKWTTITPSQWITQNLQYHAAIYIPANDKILVYAGTYDGTAAASANTWLIGASDYTVAAQATSSHAGVKPILLRWSDADICLVGGDTSSQAVSLFNPTTGWRESGATLAEPLSKDSSSMQAVMVTGDDNSKNLVTFDLSVSPNSVRRFVLQDASGAPVANSAAVTKRELSLSSWPEYNSTNAPDTTRSNYAVAQSSDGTVVFSGGGSDDSPLAMFDVNENSWLNSSDVFAVQKQLIESSTSSTKTKTGSKTTSTFASSTATGTSTGSLTLTDTSATATSTDGAAVAGGSSSSTGLSSNAVLGITLGSIIGFLAFLLVILLLIKRRKRTSRQPDQESVHSRALSGDEKAPIVMNDAPNPVSSPGHLRGHNHQFSQESFSSMAILMGRAGKSKAGKPSLDISRGNPDSDHKQLKSTISKPILQEMQHPVLQNQEPRGVAFDSTAAEPRPRQRPTDGQGQMEVDDGMRRSSGWNRYWSGGSALQILGFGGPKRITVTDDDRSSHYSEATQQPRNPRVTQDSATVPPLNFDFRPEMNRVNSGSPVVEQGHHPFKEGVVAKIERPISKVSSSGYSSGVPESVVDQWDSSQNERPWGTDRAPSSVYNTSGFFGTPLSPSTIPNRHPPSGVSTQPQLAMASTSSDMSWLNLGDKNERRM